MILVRISAVLGTAMLIIGDRSGIHVLSYLGFGLLLLTIFYTPLKKIINKKRKDK
ncbi:MAG: hypothetical protein AB9836_01005 [Aminipila sp.]